MQVPQALVDRLDDVEHRYDAARRKVIEAQAALDTLDCVRSELEAAIEIIEKHEAPLTAAGQNFQTTVSYENLYPASEALILEHAPSRARRNIKQMVWEYMAGYPGATLTAKKIAGIIGAQVPQVEKALGKLAEEDIVKNGGAGWWLLPIEPPPDFAPAPESVDRPAVFEAADIISFLTERPEGASLEEIGKFGLSVKEALELGEVWQDARGYYHATASEAATE